MISPRSVTNRVGSGLITAAKNSVTKIKESTQRISKVSDKDQKFVMNYVQFFGSKKTAKILKKSLESIKQSIVATLEIASTLKKFIGEASKMMKKRGGGLFTGGGIGSLIGGGLGLMFGKGALITLGLLAAGGIAVLLYQFRDEVFNFLIDFFLDRRDQIADIISPIIQQQIDKVFYPKKLQDEDIETKILLNQKIDEIMENDELRKDLEEKFKGKLPENKEDAAFELAKKVLIDEAEKMGPQRADFPFTRAGGKQYSEAMAEFDKESIDRRIALLRDDKANRGILKDDGTVVPLSALLGRQFVTPFDTQVTIAYERYDPKRKFNLLKRQIELDGSLAISKDKAERALINGTEAERLFAQDILSIVDSLRESGLDDKGLNQMDVKQFTPSTKDTLVSAASNINTKDIERQFPGTVVAFNPNGNGKNKSNASAGGGGGGEVLNGSNESGASSGTNGFLASSNSDDSTLKSRTMLEIC